MDFWFETESWLRDSITMRFVFTIAVLAVAFFLRSIAGKWLKRLLEKHDYKDQRALLSRKIFNFGIAIGATIAIFIIWGANAKNIWIYLSSILGVIAIGFFATWSILSNIVAGILIYTSNPFKISSKLYLFDPELTGTVIDIGILYTQLKDEDGITQIPNSVFFQKPFKVLKN